MPDALALPVAGREVIQRGYLGRRKRSRSGLVGDALPAGAKMRPRLGTIIESEDAFDLAVQFVGQHHRAGAAAIGTALMLEPFKINLEGVVELSNRAGEMNTSSGRRLRARRSDHAMRRISSPPEYLRVSAKFTGELLARQVLGTRACHV